MQGERVGFTMVTDPEDPFDAKFNARSFAPELVLALRQLLRRGDWVVDAGAQKGYITLHAASLVGKSGRVFAFEPDPRSRKILERNCILNSMTNVKIISSALGDSPAMRMLKLSSQLGWTSFYPNERNNHTTIGEQEIHVSTMDAEIQTALNGVCETTLAFVKIDCEGSEPEILRGMNNLLAEFSPVIWVEINTASLRVAGSSEQEVLEILRAQRYRSYLPRVALAQRGLRVLSLSAYSGNPADDSHRVFDVIAIRPSDVVRLVHCGVSFE